MVTIVNTRKDYIAKLKKIPFFKEGMHPEYLPFVGDNYPEYKILQVAESHYIPNFKKKTVYDGKVFSSNEIKIDDFDGWWDGNVPDGISQYKGWYTTDMVVRDYIDGYRTKAHGVLTNVLKSFCDVVLPEQSFDSISDDDGKKYNYFAYMNFWQMPSLYKGENFSKASFESMQLCNNGLCEKELLKKYDDFWYKCFQNSVEVFEAVVDALEPNLILITSSEISTSYKTYGIRVENEADAKYKDRNGYLFMPGKLDGDPRIIYLDHPGCSWWNKKKKDEEETSRERLEDKLKAVSKKEPV